MPGQKIPGRGPLGWAIAVLLMGAALGLAIHVEDTGPHDFAKIDTTPTSGVASAATAVFPDTTTPSTSTTVSTTSTTTPSGPTTSGPSTTTTTRPPKADNVLVGNTLLVRSASENGNNIPIQSRLTIRFRQDGAGQSATWTGGCNSISAPVVITENTITVGQITSTSSNCTGSTGAEENFVTALMRSNPHWDLTADAVVLDGGGRRIVADAFAS